MVAAYLGGNEVILTISMVDADGNAIAANTVDYRVIDQNQTEIVPRTALAAFTAEDTEAVVTITALQNAVSATVVGPLGVAVPNSRDLRVVELYAVTAVGTIKLEEAYMIEAEEVLLEGVNSFQTYTSSIYVAVTLNDLDGWNAASKSDRINALIRARENIGHLTFSNVSDLSLLTATEWASLDDEFKQMLRRAQVLEAGYLLGGDEIGDFRRDGVLSMTVGEAKQFLRPAKPLAGPVCRRAYNELAKYIFIRTRIGRA